jgi:hypothetical protein
LTDKPIHVLLIDDDALLLRGLEKNLRRAGFNVSLAQNAAEALVAANFGGLEPAQAVENTLRTALTRNPAVALAAAEPLRKTARRDPALAALIGEVDYRRGELAAAHETYRYGATPWSAPFSRSDIAVRPEARAGVEWAVTNNLTLGLEVGVVGQSIR